MPPRKANRKGPKKALTTEDLAAQARLRQAAREAATGNEWWKARGRHGRLPLIPDTDEGRQLLIDTIEDYFRWCEDNPYMEDKLFAYEGVVTHEPQAKKRIPLIGGLALFIGVSETTWRKWKAERNDLASIIAWAEDYIRQEALGGATAGLYNPMIVSRLHGLAERTEVSGPNGKPLQTENINREMTPQEAAEAYARTRENKE